MLDRSDSSSAQSGSSAASFTSESSVREHKPRVYALDTFDAAGTAYAQDKFDLVQPGDPGWDSWRENAIGLLVGSTPVTASDIEKSKHLKYISRHGVGYDKIDIPAAKAKKIVVTNCPGVNAIAVAEVAVALTCTLAKKITSIDSRIKAGQNVRKEDALDSILLTGKKLGLIGGGNIGQKFAQMMHYAFGCEIIVYDPYLPENSPWQLIPHTQVATVDELLPLCDILSLHVPLSESTKDLIGYREFQLMKRNVIIINTARGGIINEKDLLQALDDGLIAGAGIDAWETEPPTLEHYGKKIQNDRLILTPHIGAATVEIRTLVCMSMVDHMYEMMTGLPVRDQVC